MEYAVEELPLPSFSEVFGDGILSNPLKKKKKNSSGSKVEVSGEETTGRWTPDEHRLFLEGIMLYGKDWKKMQPLIKTRSLVQIRTHAQKVFKKIGLKKIGPGLKNGDLTKDDVEELDGLDDAELATIDLAMAAAEQEESENHHRAGALGYLIGRAQTHSVHDLAIPQHYSSQLPTQIRHETTQIRKIAHSTNEHLQDILGSHQDVMPPLHLDEQETADTPMHSQLHTAMQHRSVFASMHDDQDPPMESYQ